MENRQALVLASSSGCDLRVYSFCPFNPAPVRGSQNGMESRLESQQLRLFFNTESLWLHSGIRVWVLADSMTGWRTDTVATLSSSRLGRGSFGT